MSNLDNISEIDPLKLEESVSIQLQLGLTILKKTVPYLYYSPSDKRFFLWSRSKLQYVFLDDSTINLIITNSLLSFENFDKKLLENSRYLQSLKNLLRNIIFPNSEKYRQGVFFRNGWFTVDSVTGNSLFFPYNPKILVFEKLDYDYDPTQELFPEVESFFYHLGNGSALSINMIRYVIALLIMNYRKNHLIFTFYGTQGCGKSTISEFFRFLIGNFYSEASGLDKLSDKFETSTLVNKRLVLFSDVIEQQLTKSATSVIKQISCGDAIKIRKMYQSGELAYINTTMIFTSNMSLQFEDPGLSRRFIMFPINRSLDKVDLNFFSTLCNNVSAILKWASPMVLLLNELKPNDVSEINKELNVGFHPLEFANFIFECLCFKPGNRLRITCKDPLVRNVLYTEYVDWCKRNDLKMLSSQKFKATLLNHCNVLKIPVKEGRYSDFRYIENLTFDCSDGMQIIPFSSVFIQDLKNMDCGLNLDLCLDRKIRSDYEIYYEEHLRDSSND